MSPEIDILEREIARLEEKSRSRTSGSRSTTKYLMFDTAWQKRIFLTGSVVMAISVLITRNHYTVDVMSAYFISYSIYCLSRKLYFSHIRPLYLAASTELHRLTKR